MANMRDSAGTYGKSDPIDALAVAPSALREDNLPEQRVWAIEDCRNMTRRLERDLLAAGERIVRVPPDLRDKQ
jgi:hypothetical protein